MYITCEIIDNIRIHYNIIFDFYNLLESLESCQRFWLSMRSIRRYEQTDAYYLEIVSSFFFWPSFWAFSLIWCSADTMPLISLRFHHFLGQNLSLRFPQENSKKKKQTNAKNERSEKGKCIILGNKLGEVEIEFIIDWVPHGRFGELGLGSFLPRASCFGCRHSWKWGS